MDNNKYEPDSGENETILDNDSETSYRYVAEMIKLRDGIDINADPAIKKLICDEISPTLDNLKKGGIVFLRCDVNSAVCGDFKISIDLNLKNAKCYLACPIGNMDEKLIASQVDSCINNLKIAYSRNQKIEAARYCIMALTYAPARGDIWRTLGKIYREQNCSVRAVECYETAIKLNPEDELAYSGATAAYAVLNQFEKSKECAEKALALMDKKGYDKKDYNYAVTLANYSFAELKAGNKKQAKEILRRAKKAGYKNYKTIEKMMK